MEELGIVQLANSGIAIMRDREWEVCEIVMVQEGGIELLVERPTRTQTTWLATFIIMLYYLMELKCI